MSCLGIVAQVQVLVRMFLSLCFGGGGEFESGGLQCSPAFSDFQRDTCNEETEASKIELTSFLLPGSGSVFLSV